MTAHIIMASKEWTSLDFPPGDFTYSVICSFKCCSRCRIYDAQVQTPYT